MKQTIRIDIKEYNDFTHPYFLATSPDVDGLLVEGKTFEEVVELVPIVLNNLLRATKERLGKQAATLVK
jgi:predicted RNase H-like HicB family nuclease